jgi:hypothetical protein
MREDAGTRNPRVIVTLDSGSHINAADERPAKPVRSSGWFANRRCDGAGSSTGLSQVFSQE